jgi:hypothetical protein
MPHEAIFTQGRPVPVSYACADAGGASIAECTAAVPSGGLLPTSTPGLQTFTVTARDAAGNVTQQTLNYRVLDATNVNGSVGGSVAPTLSLTLGTPATFGPFTPGVAKDYAAATTATIVSTAADATLSVADPSPTNTGHLANGSFSLPQVLQASGNGGAFAPVGGSANPTTLLTYGSPVSNAGAATRFARARTARP